MFSQAGLNLDLLPAKNQEIGLWHMSHPTIKILFEIRYTIPLLRSVRLGQLQLLRVEERNERITSWTGTSFSCPSSYPLCPQLYFQVRYQNQFQCIFITRAIFGFWKWEMSKILWKCKLNFSSYECTKLYHRTIERLGKDFWRSSSRKQFLLLYLPLHPACFCLGNVDYSGNFIFCLLISKCGILV